MSASTVKDNDGIGPMDLLYSSAEQVLRSVQAGLGVHVLSNFVDSVHWKEPFIFSLITMHTAIFALTYVTRKYNNVQFGILTLLTAVSIGAERLNQLGQNYWPLFATQDYFDQSGLFMLVFVCGPFVIIANFIVVSFYFFKKPIYLLICVNANSHIF